MFLSIVRCLAIAGFAAIVVGSVLPWAEFHSAAFAGFTDGDSLVINGQDTKGSTTLALGVVGILLLLVRNALAAFLAAVLAVLSVGFTVQVLNDLADLARVLDADEGVSRGAGIPVVLVGAVVGGLFALVYMDRLLKRNSPPAPAPHRDDWQAMTPTKQDWP